MNFLSQFSDNPAAGAVYLMALIVSITIHEFAHAWTAYRLGDDTPYLMGRVTLNPLAHLDPLGSLLFLFTGFGWGKPVLYNPNNVRGRFDELLVALAGPASNILIAIFCNLLANVVPGSLALVLSIVAYINVLLASFNLVPIPPLDGSSIIAYFWPEYRSYFAGQMGFFILLAVVFIPVGGSTILGIVMQPIAAVITQVTTLGGIL